MTIWADTGRVSAKLTEPRLRRFVGARRQAVQKLSRVAQNLLRPASEGSERRWEHPGDKPRARRGRRGLLSPKSDLQKRASGPYVKKGQIGRSSKKAETFAAAQKVDRIPQDSVKIFRNLFRTFQNFLETGLSILRNLQDGDEK